MTSSAESELYGAIAEMRTAYIGLAPAPAPMIVKRPRLRLEDDREEETLRDREAENAKKRVLRRAAWDARVAAGEDIGDYDEDPSLLDELRDVEEVPADPVLERLDTALADFQAHMKLR